jgi:SAM-dependent methyltransferase
VLCRTAFSFGLLEREGDGWRMAVHFDQILGNPESSFYLACAPKVHMVLGEDYRDYPGHFRAGTTRPYQEHGEQFMREVAEALKTLPRIFLDLVLPTLPGLQASLAGGGRGLQSVDELGEDGTYDVATSFLVVHEIAPARKQGAFGAVARALKPGGHFLIFDEAYPETDEALQQMPTRFAALAQWYELTWGNVVDTRTALLARCQEAGLEVAEETSFSRFSILVAVKT